MIATDTVQNGYKSEQEIRSGSFHSERDGEDKKACQSGKQISEQLSFPVDKRALEESLNSDNSFSAFFRSEVGNRCTTDRPTDYSRPAWPIIESGTVVKIFMTVQDEESIKYGKIVCHLPFGPDHLYQVELSTGEHIESYVHLHQVEDYEERERLRKYLVKLQRDYR